MGQNQLPSPNPEKRPVWSMVYNSAVGAAFIAGGIILVDVAIGLAGDEIKVGGKEALALGLAAYAFIAWRLSRGHLAMARDDKGIEIPGEIIDNYHK